MTIKLLAFDGSGRPESINAKVLDIVVSAIRSEKIEVTRINLRDYHLPIYEMDDEIAHGLPQAAIDLKKLFNEHHGLLIASPEYNGAPTALLKNAIDWASRKHGDEKPLQAFKGKVAGLISASPGKLGGLRGIYMLNTILFGLGSIVLPEIIALGGSNDAFDENGQLKNDPDKNAAKNLAARIIDVTTRLNQ
jgi:NAD(P)H-dependent FMN reductase